MIFMPQLLQYFVYINFQHFKTAYSWIQMHSGSLKLLKLIHFMFFVWLLIHFNFLKISLFLWFIFVLKLPFHFVLHFESIVHLTQVSPLHFWVILIHNLLYTSGRNPQDFYHKPDSEAKFYLETWMASCGPQGATLL